jgi:hypothetical protein
VRVCELHPSEEGMVARFATAFLSGRLILIFVRETKVADSISKVVPTAAIKSLLEIEKDEKSLQSCGRVPYYSLCCSGAVVPDRSVLGCPVATTEGVFV